MMFQRAVISSCLFTAAHTDRKKRIKKKNLIYHQCLNLGFCEVQQAVSHAALGQASCAAWGGCLLLISHIYSW